LYRIAIILLQED